MLSQVLEHLGALVSFDTRNPPRRIGPDGIFTYLQTHLPGFSFDLIDHGAGAVSLLARRGKPSRVYNVHLDTVPDSKDWTASPFVMRDLGDRVVGLGVCDIKGAAAAMIVAASRTSGPVALLFSSDEEANDPRCIAAFLRDHPEFTEAIIAEPTQCEAVLAHRGIASVLIEFEGTAGHASSASALTASAVHQALNWGSAALSYISARQHERFGGLTGLRFNIGTMEGGIKANVIAPSSALRFNFRPLPSTDVAQMHDDLRDVASDRDIAPVRYTKTFWGPSLPAGDIALAEDRRLLARDLAEELDLPIGNAVDFWTEASLFSAAGLTAFVFGPGDIAQAHTADEWVLKSQLQTYTEHLIRLFDAGTEIQ